MQKRTRSKRIEKVLNLHLPEEEGRCLWYSPPHVLKHSEQKTEICEVYEYSNGWVSVAYANSRHNLVVTSEGRKEIEWADLSSNLETGEI
jgi:hypothetical protein